MQIERIDTDEILGLTCPTTGHRLLWNDEDSGDILPETVVSAVVSSLCSEECAVEALPLEGRPIGGITCGPVTDVT